MSTQDAQTSTRQSLDRLLSPEAKDAMGHLDLFARRTVEGLMHGIHRSKRIGVSTEFDHHTEYHPGDPLKHMDWRASARHDRYFVKRYVEDTALTVRLVVDRSASMLRATDGDSKYLQACRLAACLAYVVIKERDAAGLVLTTSEDTTWVPAGSSDTQLVIILSELARREAIAEDNLQQCLRTILDRQEQRGLVVVISDLMFDPEPVQREMASLIAQGHEVLLFQPRDPAEEEFPFNRWVQFQDLEQLGRRHRVDTVPLKRIYREEYEALIEQWRTWGRKHGAHFITFRTDEHVEGVVSQYIGFRNRAVR